MSDFLDWSDFAGCRDSDPGLFFGPENETASAKARREELANAVCAGCIVRTACLRYIVDHPELTGGTWAGRNEDEIRAERRRRRQRVAA